MLSVDISLIVVFIVVWILVVVLTRLFFKPIKKLMGQRDESIEQDHAAGAAAASEYEEIIRKIESDVKQTRSAALATRQDLEKQAQEHRDRLLGDVSRECREQVNRARSELDLQVESMKAELSAESERLAEQIEKKLLN